MRGVDRRVPHTLWIAYEEDWDDWLCQGWVWAQPTLGKRGSYHKVLAPLNKSWVCRADLEILAIPLQQPNLCTNEEGKDCSSSLCP